MAYTLRPARETDLEQLLSIENVCFGTDKISRRQMRYLVNRAKALTLVVVDVSDVAVGYGMVFMPEPTKRSARLYSLAVSPECRGQGLGSKLASELLGLVQGKGYGACVLEVRQSDMVTQQLYRRLGFQPMKSLPAYYADGENGLRMRLIFRAFDE